MSTLSQLQTQQATARAAYLAAVQQLETAYVSLAALDSAISNVSGSPARSFGFNMDHLRTTLAAHPACFNASDGSAWYRGQPVTVDQVRAAANIIVSNFTPGS